MKTSLLRCLLLPMRRVLYFPPPEGRSIVLHVCIAGSGLWISALLRSRPWKWARRERPGALAATFAPQENFRGTRSASTWRGRRIALRWLVIIDTQTDWPAREYNHILDNKNNTSHTHYHARTTTTATIIPRRVPTLLHNSAHWSASEPAPRSGESNFQAFTD